MKGGIRAVCLVAVGTFFMVLGRVGPPMVRLASAADYTFQVSGGPSTSSDISANGRYVVFQSLANDLVDNDTNGVQDIFVHDRDADDNGILDEHDKPGGVSTIRVSVDSDGNPAAGGDSVNPAISDDGRFIVFQSNANNLVANDTNGVQDIFVHDRDVSNDKTFDEPNDLATIRVSVASDGTPAAGGDSTNPDISGDGRYVVFQSLAPNLANFKDDPGLWDIFRHDISTGDTVLVNVDSNGNEATGGNSTNPHISGNGRYVVFQSLAPNLANFKDDPGLWDIFRHDVSTGNTILVNVDSNGNEAAGGNSTNPHTSTVGRYVVFQSYATNLLGPGNDTNGVQDIFVHDCNTDDTTRANVDSSGKVAAGGDSVNPAISTDDRHVSFESNAHDLVDDDTNGLPDIFVHDHISDATVRISVRTIELSSSGTLTSASSGSGGGSGCFITAAGHGSLVVFVCLLVSVILGTTMLLPWKVLKKCATHRK